MSAVRETLIAPDARGGFSLDALWHYRDLIVLLARRDIAVRYRQTALGVAWALLQPLGMVTVFTIVLGRLAKMPTGGTPYALLVLSGWLAWQFFSQAMNAAGNSVVNNPNLVTKVYFPRLAIPVAALGAPAVDLVVTCGLMAGFMAGYGRMPGLSILLLPMLFLLLALIAFGVGCLVAALSVSYRDFRHLMPIATTLWMWLTPVVYPLWAVPEQWRWLALLNPLTGIVQGIRSAWLDLPFDWVALESSFAGALFLVWAGVAYFRRVERQFADMI